MSKWCVVIAAGPSLLREDCDALRGMDAIAVNCGVFFAPWAQTLYAADKQWWSNYEPKIKWYKGRRLSRHRGPGIETWHGKGWLRTGGNSGHQALQLAIERGFKHIALIGFDHKHTGGKTHFHGDHRPDKRIKLGNAKNIHVWVRAMNRTALDIEKAGIEVVNLSRETALECFPRMTVEDFLQTKNNVL